MGHPAHEMDFGVVATEGFRGQVEMIFGESKSGMSLTEDERQKLKEFGKKTGSYVCFCTLADDSAMTTRDISGRFMMTA